MNFKKGFSIVEILVALIVVSVITAALAPVITKKLSGSSITVLGGNGGNINLADIPTISCDAFENCAICTQKGCLTCDIGYEKSSEGVCVAPEEEEEEVIVTRAPQSQKDCDLYKAHYFDGLCITKGNVGDTSNGGPGAEGVEGITVLSPGSTSKTDTWCFKGTTAGACSDYVNSTYNSCKRTVCSWKAAKIACENYDVAGTKPNSKGKWRLPSKTELQTWAEQNNSQDLSSANSKLTKWLGARGLDLCDASEYAPEHYDASRCSARESCPSNYAPNKYCYPYYIWGDESSEGSSTAATAYISGYDLNVGDDDKGYSFGARCVIDEIEAPEIKPPVTKDLSDYKTPESQSECDPYKAHYFNGTCITKANIGDVNYDGPPIDSSGVATAGIFSDYNIQVLSVGNKCTTKNCCWLGQTADAAVMFTPTKKNYPSSNRTVCTWWAANEACKNYDINDSKGLWELPSQGDLAAWVDVMNNVEISRTSAVLARYLGSDGINVCDSHSNAPDHYGTSYCSVRADYCPIPSGAANHCYPYHIWGQEAALNKAYAFYVSTWEAVNYLESRKDYAFGGRCVLRKVKKGNEAQPEEEKDLSDYKTPESQSECDPYKAHYFNGMCITKANVGDIAYDGPPLDSSGVASTGAFSDYDIQVLSASSKCTTKNCCWLGQTAGASGTFKPTKIEYPGSNRTVCTWEAANTACKNYGINDSKGLWELPSRDDLNVWANTMNSTDISRANAVLSRHLGSDGINLCDDSEYAPEHYGSTRCSVRESCPIPSGGSNYCYPHYIWGKEEGANSAAALYLHQSTATSYLETRKDYAFGARCVLKKVKKGNEAIPEQPKDLSNYKTPQSQSECDPYNALYYKNACITKANSGDIQYGGAPLSSGGDIVTGLVSDYNIQVLNPGSKCTSKTCCWKGTTAAGCSTFNPTKRGYSGCTRTVCDWWAANIACKNYDINDSKGLWELPNSNDLINWATEYNSTLSYTTSVVSRYLGSDGLDFCDSSQYASEHYGAAQCSVRGDSCPIPSGSSNHCYPSYLWGQENSLEKANAFYVSDNSAATYSNEWKTIAFGSRCVLRKVKKGNEATAEAADTRSLKTPTSQADCDKYNAFFFNNSCITKVNAGDAGGPPLDSSGVSTSGVVTDYDIHVLGPGSKCFNRHCCWQGQTADGCATYATSTYTACNRTVCTWWAGDTACKQYDINDTKGLWSLPSQAQLTSWKTQIASETATNHKLTLFMGDQGLNLCDSSEYGASHYGSSYCGYRQMCNMPNGSGTNYCEPMSVWGSAIDNNPTTPTAYSFYLSAQAASVGTDDKHFRGKSVRCVLNKVPVN